MVFKYESEFEEAIIQELSHKGWEREVLKYPTQKDLLRNWADILFENNRGIDRLNNYPLTDSEMDQILEQIAALRTPLKLNGFINGKTVSVTRDHPDDTLHYGKEISLKIYDRKEIAAGQSRYQIAQQPIFPGKSGMYPDRRGDLMLLINGMPVIHMELKKSGVPISQAWNQIEKYTQEGAFTGLFSLVQIFVAMNPNEAVYFANPGPEGAFNKNYYFHWANFYNEPINDWKEVTSSLLSIPMAHQMIGFYTVADTADGVLKVMRSYQYYAASAISDQVAKTKWGEGNQLGGYVWHTTGSGKTMTSFKSAQLIAASNDADKVIFLTDRIELGTQSLKEYRSFASEKESVQATENTKVLAAKLKSNGVEDTLIVTSIQKMSNIHDDDEGLNASDVEIIRKKRLVFIIDEAHRSTFGEMLITIKDTFPDAIFFGFTGTPIHEENQKKKSTTAMIFGKELHRYSIADGIRDKNVLGFDLYKVSTFRDEDIRKLVALEQAKASTPEEARKDPQKAEIYYHFMSPAEVKMAGDFESDGKYVKGIEDYIPTEQYRTEEHREMVVKDIMDHWPDLSREGKFHGIFATGSIPEAVEYYHLLKKKMPELKTTCLFDPSIDNNGQGYAKEEWLAEIITDYNERYGQDFTIPTHAAFKKDLSDRLAHKEPYIRISRIPEMQIDLLIVVDQMLTGFDSKWVNTLYLDKMLEYENIIQAFSRTNRLFGPDKPFGVIRYYRKVNTMEKNIEAAVKAYSGDKPMGLFVEKLPSHLEKMNEIYGEISELFQNAGVANFERLPEDYSERAKFASLFNGFNSYLEAARVQGFRWEKQKYGKTEVLTDEKTYLILAQRYKELAADAPSDERKTDGGITYDLDGHLTEINTGAIDENYMNSRFVKYVQLLQQSLREKDQLNRALDELHQTFAMLSQEEQKYANLFLHDVQRGEIVPEEGKSFRDYITEYQYRAQNDRIRQCAAAFGMDEGKLREMTELHLTENNINEFGRFDELMKTVDRKKARAFFEEREGIKLIPPKVNMRTDSYLRRFILTGGGEMEET